MFAALVAARHIELDPDRQGHSISNVLNVAAVPCLPSVVKMDLWLRLAEMEPDRPALVTVAVRRELRTITVTTPLFLKTPRPADRTPGIDYSMPFHFVATLAAEYMVELRVNGRTEAVHPLVVVVDPTTGP